MRLLLAAILAAQTAAPQPPPDVDIFLAPLTINGAVVTIGPPINITNNPGYDNQPAFTPDGKSVLFTSVRGGRTPDPKNPAMTGSDIYRYDISAKKVTQVTATAESEYSPTVTPDGRHISVIRVEPDGTQRLWRFTSEGQQPELLLTDIKPVGYHAWAGETTVALFVLGQPNTLQVADTRTGKAVPVANGIGRSLQRMPNGSISFVLRQAGVEGAPPELTVTELTPATRQTRPLVRVPRGATEADTAWTPDGLLVIPREGQLLGWRSGETELKPVADLKALGLQSVTRLAISPKGDWIALVAVRP